MKPLETTAEEILRDAIASEVETRLYFQKLADRASAPAVRKRLLELADAELVHRAKLERRYREQVGHPPPDPPVPSIEIPREIARLDLARALKLALERERDAESHYRHLAERAHGTPLGKLLLDLAETEWQHKTELQAEYDRAVADNPDQFLLDM